MLKKLVMCFALVGTTVLANEEIILKQQDAPLKIVSYSSSYKNADRGIGDGSIIHRLSVENVSKSQVVAYGLGFRTFDAFKRAMGRPFIGYDMSGVNSGAQTDPIWENRTASAYLYRKHGLGVAYVAIARLEDGTIWKADEASIENQLIDLELDLESAEAFEE